MIHPDLVPAFESYIKRTFSDLFPHIDQERFFAELAQKLQIKRPLTLEQKLRFVTGYKHWRDLESGEAGIPSEEVIVLRGRGRPENKAEIYFIDVLADIFRYIGITPRAAWNDCLGPSTPFAKALCFLREVPAFKELGYSDQALVKKAQRELKKQKSRDGFAAREMSRYPELAELDRLARERAAGGGSYHAAYDFILAETPQGRALYASYAAKTAHAKK